MARQLYHRTRGEAVVPARPTRMIGAIIARALSPGGLLLLGLALLGLAAAMALGATYTPPARVAGGVQPNANDSNANNTNANNGNGGQGGVWIPLRSTAPADIIAAARRSQLFKDNGPDGGDHITDVSRLGVPVLVRAIQPPGAANGAYPDFYVLPILDRNGAASSAAELQLNQSHTAIHVIAIVTYSAPRVHGVVAMPDPTSAQGALSAQRHLALRPGAAPVLAYFPGDAAAQEMGQVTWMGGGEFPADPIWLMAAANGHQYVVGTDGHVYDISQLPMVQVMP